MLLQEVIGYKLKVNINPLLKTSNLLNIICSIYNSKIIEIYVSRILIFQYVNERFSSSE